MLINTAFDPLSLISIFSKAKNRKSNIGTQNSEIEYQNARIRNRISEHKIRTQKSKPEVKIIFSSKTRHKFCNFKK